MQSLTNISVFLIDDHRLITDLLKDYLNETSQITVSNVFYDGESFLSYLNQKDITLPNVIILDLKMKEIQGEYIIRELTTNYSQIKIIVLSAYYQPDYLGFMFKIGAHAFLPKEIPKDALVSIIKEVHTKGYFFDNNQIQVLRNDISTNIKKLQIDQKDQLSEREVEVLKLLCEQMTANEIGLKLFISKKTVETHKANLLLKTGAKNIAGLIIFASQNNLVNLNKIKI